MVLFFVLKMRILITHWCFSGCKSPLAQSQGLFYYLYWPDSKDLVVHRKLGENRTRILTQIGQRDNSYCMLSCRKTKLEDSGKANVAQGQIGDRSCITCFLILCFAAFFSFPNLFFLSFSLLTKFSLSQHRSSFISHCTGGWAV